MGIVAKIDVIGSSVPLNDGGFGYKRWRATAGILSQKRHDLSWVLKGTLLLWLTTDCEGQG